VYELLVIRMGHFRRSQAPWRRYHRHAGHVRTTGHADLGAAGMKDASTAMGALPWRTITD